MPNTFHTDLPLLLFLCTHGLVRMHSPSHAACIYPLDSFLFNHRGLTHTHPLLHKPTFSQPALTQTLFYTKHFLQKSTFTPTSLYTNQLTQTRFSTNHLSHQPALTQTSFYTHQLLGKATFRPTSLYTNPPFAPTNLYKSAFTQTNF